MVVSTSEICFIDGDRVASSIAGYDIHDLVEHSSFEETAALLWNGALPKRAELERLRKASRPSGGCPKVLTLVRGLPRKSDSMDVLRTAVSALGIYDPDAGDNSREANLRKAVRIQAQVPTLVAAWSRIRKGKAPVTPNARLSLGGNLLYMLTGRKPSALAEKAMDTSLILHADHELNASTFAARVTVATLSDMYSGVVVGHRDPEGSAPRRRERRRHPDAARDRVGSPSAETWIKSARQGADHGLRPPRLQHRGSAGDAPPPDVRGAGAGQPGDLAGTRCPGASRRSSTRRRAERERGLLLRVHLLLDGIRPSSTPRSSSSSGSRAGPPTSWSSRLTTA